MRSQTTRTIAGRVNANGTVASGADFTVRPAGTGVYVITFPRGFRLMGATASPATGITNRAVDLQPNSAGELVANVFVATTAVGENNQFSFTAVGAA